MAICYTRSVVDLKEVFCIKKGVEGILTFTGHIAKGYVCVNMPKINSSGDFFKSIVLKALDGIGAAETGKFVLGNYNIYV